MKLTLAILALLLLAPQGAVAHDRRRWDMYPITIVQPAPVVNVYIVPPPIESQRPVFTWDSLNASRGFPLPPPPQSIINNPYATFNAGVTPQQWRMAR